MSDLSELRVVVFDLAQNRCEHPTVRLVWKFQRCALEAVELAHVYPRGMGHNGYRNTPAHVIAACWLHSRSTDDLSSPVWISDVPQPHDRRALYEWIREDRERRGYGMLNNWETEWRLEVEAA